MKKLVYVIAIIAVAVTGCKKDTKSDPAVPAPFTQKTLVEEFTGAWCGYCPDGATKIQSIINAHPETAIGVAVHQGDGMEISLYTELDNTFTVTGFPTGMVSRKVYNGDVMLDRGQWAGAASGVLASTAKCGLAIESALSGTDSAAITVHCGFNEVLTGDYRLTVYLIEDSVTGTGAQYNQRNYYNTDASSPFYQLGDPMVGYKHNHVLRKVLTADAGTVIPAANIIVGTDYKVAFNIPLTGMNKANVHVIAFITKYGTTALTHKVENVQEVKLDDDKDWD
ncbi:hypothetical protein BH11BAC2_BH11BAC2_18290 [soil metagenome]